MSTTATTTRLPKIVAIIESFDSGEYGNATCAHCGAQGRYYKTFRCEDGTTRQAMAGCIKLFPMSDLANEHAKLLDKQRTRKMNGWDTKKLDAITAVVAGTMTVDEARQVVREQNRQRDAWMDRKRGGRR